MKNKWNKVKETTLRLLLAVWLVFVSSGSTTKFCSANAIEDLACTLASTEICYDKNIQAIPTIEHKGTIAANKKETITDLPVEELTLAFASPSLQDSVYKYMQEKVAFPAGALALAVHETGNFTSRTFRLGNNMFGMKAVAMLNCDYTVWSTGDNHNKCGWSDWKECIDAYAEWEIRKGITRENTKSIGDYTSHLRRIGYAADPLHKTKVTAHFKKLFI